MHVDDPEALPAVPGAYALVIETHRDVRMAVAGRRRVDFPEGVYLYVGSANGPGGIRARVRRHLKGAKTVRWHVDRLTNAFGVATVVALPGGTECAIMRVAVQWPGVTVPAPGFGSSDCRTCAAHLARLPEPVDVARRADEIAAACGATGSAVWHRPPVLCILPPPKSPGTA